MPPIIRATTSLDNKKVDEQAVGKRSTGIASASFQLLVRGANAKRDIQRRIDKAAAVTGRTFHSRNPAWASASA